MIITPILRRAGTAAIAATLATLPMTVADAATRTPTTLTLSLPATIDYGQLQQTVTGTLETSAAAGATPQPVPGATIRINEPIGRANVDLGTTTTDENGEFSLPVTLPAPGLVEATFAGDDTYTPARRSAKVAPSATLPTRITLHGPASVAPEAKFTVTGQVTMQAPDGTWVPAPYEAVTPYNAAGVTGWMNADADGRFSFSPSAWFGLLPKVCVFTDGTFVRSACSDPLVTPYSSYPVRITDFKAEHEPLNPGNFSFFADVSYEPDDANTAPYNGPVTLQYRPKGSSTWIQMASGTATGSYSTPYESYGEVEFKNLSGFLPGGKGVLAAGGTWEVRTPAQGAYLASENSDQLPLIAVVDAPTYITGSTVTSRSGSRYLTSYLYDDHNVGPVPNMKISIYYRPTKTGTRKYLGYVTTGSNGQFSYKLTGHARGYYQGVFAGAAMPGGASTVGYFFNSTGGLVYYR